MLLYRVGLSKGSAPVLDNLRFAGKGVEMGVESVNILVNSNGQIIRSDVVGALKMRTYLRFALYFP